MAGLIPQWVVDAAGYLLGIDLSDVNIDVQAIDDAAAEMEMAAARAGSLPAVIAEGIRSSALYAGAGASQISATLTWMMELGSRIQTQTKGSAGYLRGTCEQARRTQTAAMAGMVQTLAQLSWDVAMAPFTHGRSLADAHRAIAAAQTAIAHVKAEHHEALAQLATGSLDPHGAQAVADLRRFTVLTRGSLTGPGPGRDGGDFAVGGGGGRGAVPVRGTDQTIGHGRPGSPEAPAGSHTPQALKAEPVVEAEPFTAAEPLRRTAVGTIRTAGTGADDPLRTVALESAAAASRARAADALERAEARENGAAAEAQVSDHAWSKLPDNARTESAVHQARKMVSEAMNGSGRGLRPFVDGDPVTSEARFGELPVPERVVRETALHLYRNGSDADAVDEAQRIVDDRTRPPRAATGSEGLRGGAARDGGERSRRACHPRLLDPDPETDDAATAHRGPSGSSYRAPTVSGSGEVRIVVPGRGSPDPLDVPAFSEPRLASAGLGGDEQPAPSGSPRPAGQAESWRYGPGPGQAESSRAGRARLDVAQEWHRPDPAGTRTHVTSPEPPPRPARSAWTTELTPEELRRIGNPDDVVAGLEPELAQRVFGRLARLARESGSDPEADGPAQAAAHAHLLDLLLERRSTDDPLLTRLDRAALLRWDTGLAPDTAAARWTGLLSGAVARAEGPEGEGSEGPEPVGRHPDVADAGAVMALAERFARTGGPRSDAPPTETPVSARLREIQEQASARAAAHARSVDADGSPSTDSERNPGEPPGGADAEAQAYRDQVSQLWETQRGWIDDLVRTARQMDLALAHGADLTGHWTEIRDAAYARARQDAAAAEWRIRQENAMRHDTEKDARRRPPHGFGQLVPSATGPATRDFPLGRTGRYVRIAGVPMADRHGMSELFARAVGQAAGLHGADTDPHEAAVRLVRAEIDRHGVQNFLVRLVADGVRLTVEHGAGRQEVRLRLDLGDPTDAVVARGATAEVLPIGQKAHTAVEADHEAIAVDRRGVGASRAIGVTANAALAAGVHLPKPAHLTAGVSVEGRSSVWRGFGVDAVSAAKRLFAVSGHETFFDMPRAVLQASVRRPDGRHEVVAEQLPVRVAFAEELTDLAPVTATDHAAPRMPATLSADAMVPEASVPKAPAPDTTASVGARRGVGRLTATAQPSPEVAARVAAVPHGFFHVAHSVAFLGGVRQAAGRLAGEQNLGFDAELLSEASFLRMYGDITTQGWLTPEAEGPDGTWTRMFVKATFRSAQALGQVDAPVKQESQVFNNATVKGETGGGSLAMTVPAIKVGVTIAGDDDAPPGGSAGFSVESGLTGSLSTSRAASANTGSGHISSLVYVEPSVVNTMLMDVSVRLVHERFPFGEGPAIDPRPISVTALFPLHSQPAFEAALDTAVDPGPSVRRDPHGGDGAGPGDGAGSPRSSETTSGAALEPGPRVPEPSRRNRTVPGGGEGARPVTDPGPQSLRQMLSLIVTPRPRLPEPGRRNPPVTDGNGSGTDRHPERSFADALETLWNPGAPVPDRIPGGVEATGGTGGPAPSHASDDGPYPPRSFLQGQGTGFSAISHLSGVEQALHTVFEAVTRATARQENAMPWSSDEAALLWSKLSAYFSHESMINWGAKLFDPAGVGTRFERQGPLGTEVVVATVRAVLERGDDGLVRTTATRRLPQAKIEIMPAAFGGTGGQDSRTTGAAWTIAAGFNIPLGTGRAARSIGLGGRYSGSRSWTDSTGVDASSFAIKRASLYDDPALHVSADFRLEVRTEVRRFSAVSATGRTGLRPAAGQPASAERRVVRGGNAGFVFMEGMFHATRPEISVRPTQTVLFAGRMRRGRLEFPGAREAVERLLGPEPHAGLTPDDQVTGTLGGHDLARAIHRALDRLGVPADARGVLPETWAGPEMLVSALAGGGRALKFTIASGGVARDQVVTVGIAARPHSPRTDEREVTVFEMDVVEGGASVSSQSARSTSHQASFAFSLGFAGGDQNTFKPGGGPSGGKDVRARGESEGRSVKAVSGSLTQASKAHAVGDADVVWTVTVTRQTQNALEGAVRRVVGHDAPSDAVQVLVHVPHGVEFLRPTERTPDPRVPRDDPPAGIPRRLRTVHVAPTATKNLDPDSSRPGAPAPGPGSTESPVPSRSGTDRPSSDSGGPETPFPGPPEEIRQTRLIRAFQRDTRLVEAGPRQPAKLTRPRPAEEDGVRRRREVPLRPLLPAGTATKRLVPEAGYRSPRPGVTGTANPAADTAHRLLSRHAADALDGKWLRHDGAGEVPVELGTVLDPDSLTALMDVLLSTGLVFHKTVHLPGGAMHYQLVVHATRDPDGEGYAYVGSGEGNTARYAFRHNSESTSGTASESWSATAGFGFTDAPGLAAHLADLTPGFSVGASASDSRTRLRMTTDSARDTDFTSGETVYLGGRVAFRFQLLKTFHPSRAVDTLAGGLPGRAAGALQRTTEPGRESYDDTVSLMELAQVPRETLVGGRLDDELPPGVDAGVVQLLYGEGPERFGAQPMRVTADDLLTRRVFVVGPDQEKLRTLHDAVARHFRQTATLRHLFEDGTDAQDAMRYLFASGTFHRQAEYLLRPEGFEVPRLTANSGSATRIEGRVTIRGRFARARAIAPTENNWVESVGYGFREQGTGQSSGTSVSAGINARASAKSGSLDPNLPQGSSDQQIQGETLSLSATATRGTSNTGILKSMTVAEARHTKTTFVRVEVDMVVHVDAVAALGPAGLRRETGGASFYLPNAMELKLTPEAALAHGLLPPEGLPTGSGTGTFVAARNAPPEHGVPDDGEDLLRTAFAAPVTDGTIGLHVNVTDDGRFVVLGEVLDAGEFTTRVVRPALLARRTMQPTPLAHKDADPTLVLFAGGGDHRPGGGGPAASGSASVRSAGGSPAGSSPAVKEPARSAAEQLALVTGRPVIATAAGIHFTPDGAVLSGDTADWDVRSQLGALTPAPWTLITPADGNPHRRELESLDLADALRELTFTPKPPEGVRTVLPRVVSRRPRRAGNTGAP